jgi:hypothetical protein
MALPAGQDQADIAQAKKERAALNKVKLISFTATPTSVAPFGTSTLAWNVTIPPSNDPLVDIGVFLDDTGVAPTGSTTVSPSANRSFRLAAKGEFASRALGSVLVAVNFGGCQTQDVAVGVFAAVAKAPIDALFAGSSDIKLKPGGSTVTLDNFKVAIAIPLEINVPDWFDADMDIALTFSLFGRPTAAGDVRAFAALDDVSVDVSWSLLSHVLSLGCTGVVQAALQKQAEVFLKNLMGATAAQQLAAQVQADINTRLAALNAPHPPQPPQHFRLQSLVVSADGITYRFCPTASAAGVTSGVLAVA